MTTFKVTEKIRDFDYYLLDFDVTMSARSGTGDGGASTYRIKSTGPKLFDKNDSKTLKSDQGGCTDVAVTMSTPWPIVTASTTVGHAELCDKAATLTRSYSGADARYAGTKLAAMRHLTMQRWIKVKAGKKPSFDLGVVLPNDACTKGDGKGHCIKFDNKASSKAITINTTG
jgi:hypothetical protein